MFNEGFLWLEKTGIKERIAEKWIPVKKYDSSNNVASQILSMGHVTLVFLNLAFFLLLSFIVLVFELISKYCLHHSHVVNT